MHSLAATFSLALDGQTLAEERSCVAWGDDESDRVSETLAARHVIAVVPRAFSQAFFGCDNPCTDALWQCIVGQVERAMIVASDEEDAHELVWLHVLARFLRTMARSGEWFVDHPEAMSEVAADLSAAAATLAATKTEPQNQTKG